MRTSLSFTGAGGVHPISPRAWRVLRIAALVVPALLGLAWAFTGRPVGQSDAYHRFVDHAAALGVPNGLNVLSNAGFAAAGLLGLWRVRRAAPADRWSWATFFVAVGLTSLGSAWYHLAPSNDRLVWDRLPMAIAFMSLLAALVGERVDGRAGAVLRWPLVLAGVASVVSWHLGERAGAGNLKPYLVVQFYPLLAVPLLLLLFPDRRARAWPYLVALAAYLAAKVAEVEDGAVLHATGLLSGHTLKHLLAAAAVGALAWAPRPGAGAARREA
jgi:hypothetical protein